MQEFWPCSDYDYNTDECACTGCGCFPSESKVTLLGGETRIMSQLQVGNKVKAGMKSLSM